MVSSHRLIACSFHRLRCNHFPAATTSPFTASIDIRAALSAIVRAATFMADLPPATDAALMPCAPARCRTGSRRSAFSARRARRERFVHAVRQSPARARPQDGGLPGAPHRPGGNPLELAADGPLAHGRAVARPRPRPGRRPEARRRGRIGPGLRGPTRCCPPMPPPTRLPPWRFAPRPSRPAASRCLRRRHRSPGSGATAMPRAAPAIRGGPRGWRLSVRRRGGRQTGGGGAWRRVNGEGIERGSRPVRQPSS